MICFYHSADLDGHCSGAIVKYFNPDVKCLGINYGQMFPWDKIKEGEEVFMVDFCLQPFDLMEKLNKMCKLHWIDHHEKGSIDEAKKRGFMASGGQLIEVGVSGCELTWQYLRTMKEWIEEPPEAVTLLGRYDVWDHSNPRVLPFQYGMRQFSDTRPENQKLWADLFEEDALCDPIVDQGAVLLEYERTQNEKFCRAYAFETMLIVPIGPSDSALARPGDYENVGLKAICANRGFTNSKLFDSVYDHAKHSLMVSFVRLKLPAHKWTVSLYSTREDVDCGAIAKTFGGGGHKGAAGFQCETLPFDY